MEKWTIQKLLGWITDYFGDKGVDSPRLNGEMLLSYVLGLQRIELYVHFDQVIASDKLKVLHELVKRGGEHEPVAYLVGRTEFYSLEIKVNRDCLIPRPETELLAERAIEFLRKRQDKQYVCDLCTGSGCVAVAVAKGVKDVGIIATDICDAALSVAAENVAHHELGEQIKLLCGDLFAPVIEGLDETRFDLIVSNPPYISTSEYETLDKNVREYEPKKALHAGEEGLDVYRRIIEEADGHLKDNGALMLEIGYAQGKAIKDLLEAAGCFLEIIIEKDFQNNDRVVTAKKQAAEQA